MKRYFSLLFDNMGTAKVIIVRTTVVKGRLPKNGKQGVSISRMVKLIKTVNEPIQLK